MCYEVARYITVSDITQLGRGLSNAWTRWWRILNEINSIKRWYDNYHFLSGG